MEEQYEFYYHIAVLKGKRKKLYAIKKAVHNKHKRARQGH